MIARKMAQQPIFALLDRIGSIAADEAKYLWGVSDKLESAKIKLLRMQAFLKDLDDKMLRGGGSAMARNLVSEVREVAYELEDVIDTANILQRDPKTSISGAISKYACFPIYLTHLHKLGTRIDSATARNKTIFEDFERHNIVASAIREVQQVYITEDDIVQHWRSVHPEFGEKVDVIRFDEQIEHIKSDLLDKHNRHLTVVSIVGPGGAGKSIMAKTVYGFAAVKGHFQVTSWITVSQRFIPRDLLKEVVKHTIGVQQAESLEKKSEEEVKKLLHDFLQRKLYLIVLDDVWSTAVWDIIRDAFPDEKNGSRVIFTTRNEVVAQHPHTRKKLYKPKLLDRKESTQLLLSMSLQEYMLDGNSNRSAAAEQSLDKLKELGEDLAVKCRGLPLALVVLGGYLRRNLDVAEWRRLTSSMDWHTMISGEKVIGAVLDLSYYDMPSNLRSCFMYATAFTEDFLIDIQVLIGLWIAEGFIPLVRGHTQNEVAVNYITKLVQRSMIQVRDSARSGTGRIQAIMVHDILRDWGIGRARREGFIRDCHVVDDVEAPYSEEVVESYRVVLHENMNEWNLGPRGGVALYYASISRDFTTRRPNCSTISVIYVCFTFTPHSALVIYICPRILTV
ncbi:hypothetical protein PR202_ga18312 [Eleusine coracana subsp. coracana]|uniref:Uncharacterized protein n=1 Tax=Eleusine coracana subsp. coracana TaxID=191504 RepID=A0AAV5CT79_ELECO|nr:hypothetical protein PR202_ga18312 [Eleusine coracana subsp. coracana]